MPTILANGDVLLDAFPFQSNPNLITDVRGYKRGDRSVDSWTMRNAFRQFFSNGVFGTPADAFQIAKGTSGLSVTIQPGMCVIEGGMGGIEERNGPLTVTLDTQAAAGNVCYGIFLRYDINDDTRGIAIRVRKGDAGSSPTPPPPDTTSSGVHELRLGYVSVPNGATDLSGATVTNEKGLSVCPYSAPFAEIDMSAIAEDTLQTANAALDSLYEYFDTYRGAVDAALSDEEATYLQQQINTLQQQISDVDLAESVDNETIEYSKDSGEQYDKLRVKAAGISTGQLADYAVSADKLSAELQIQLDVVDTTGWSFSKYLSFTESLGDDDKTAFVATIDTSVFDGWSTEQLSEYAAAVPSAAQKDIASRISIASRSWEDLASIAGSMQVAGMAGFVGRDKAATLGTFGSVTCRCVGAGHYAGIGGSAPHITFFVMKGLGNTVFQTGSTRPNWGQSTIGQYMQGTILPAFPQEISSVMQECSIPSWTGAYENVENVAAKVWPVSAVELNQASKSTVPDGSVLAYFASGGSFSINDCWTRSTEAASTPDRLMINDATNAALVGVQYTEAHPVSCLFSI